jgi:NitT/TauT family transport system substrate-binding protein
MVAALKNKAIDCAVLLDPYWIQVKDDPAFFQAATQTPGEPLGMYAMGKSLLVDHPEVGQAFVRAVLRTIDTYFNGDYHGNPTVMAEIGKATGQDVSKLTTLPSLTMDWEIRAGTTDRLQQLFIDLGVITDYKTPVAESKVVDRSFYLKVVGAQ